MTAKVELTKPVQLVLLAVFQSIEKAVAKGDLGGDPRIGLGIAGAPATDQVGIAVISRELEKAVEALPGDVRSGEIDGVVALAHVERTAVDGDAVDGQRDESVGIGVAVAVRVGGQV